MSNLAILSIPGLRQKDLAHMPHLSTLCGAAYAPLTTSFPCVTWPAQAHLLTGKLADGHGVISNGFYWRESQEVEMWTAWNDKITAPQIWDLLHERDPAITSAVWFPMLSKGCGADYICMPAPVHNPDGSESLWCYTRPTEYYGELRDALGHFPLQNFWGPLASVASSEWIGKSAAHAAARYRPRFWHIYLPHLDYAAQKHGPNSDQARQSLIELDGVIGEMAEAFGTTYGGDLTWLAVSEYVINEISGVFYPNRVLREAGLLKTKTVEGGERIDFDASYAWALADHQFSHVFVKDREADTIREVVRLFRECSACDGVADVLAGPGRGKYGLDCERAGDVIVISTPQSWQAYYYWNEDAMAPKFARTVDIHRKPGYDPVELFIDIKTKGIPLDATLVKGSHGAPVTDDPADDDRRGVILCSREGVLPEMGMRDVEVCALALSLFD